jgi:hypothetical protein
MKSELIFNVFTLFGYTIATIFMLEIFKNMESVEILQVPDTEVYVLTASSKPGYHTLLVPIPTGGTKIGTNKKPKFSFLRKCKNGNRFFRQMNNF